MKSVLIDTSSAILLYKAKLFSHLIDHYSVLITASVHYELTQNRYPESGDFNRFCEQGHITILPKQASPESDQGMPRLNSGEKDTIREQMVGTADFILIDDGPAARYCQKAGLPFINALLFPRILFLTGVITEAVFDQKTTEIIQMGRYSKQIINMAVDIPNQALQSFLPSPA